MDIVLEFGQGGLKALNCKDTLLVVGLEHLINECPEVFCAALECVTAACLAGFCYAGVAIAERWHGC